MKVNRINILIPTQHNKHVKYLCNHCLDLMNKYRFSGEFRNDVIKMSSMPESVVDILKQLKINFERVK